MKLTACLSLAALFLSGCAMSPEDQDRMRANFLGGMAAGAAASQRQPVYQMPAYQMQVPQGPTRTTCQRWGNQVNCNTY